MTGRTANCTAGCTFTPAHKDTSTQTRTHTTTHTFENIIEMIWLKKDALIATLSRSFFQEWRWCQEHVAAFALGAVFLMFFHFQSKFLQSKALLRSASTQQNNQTKIVSYSKTWGRGQFFMEVTHGAIFRFALYYHSISFLLLLDLPWWSGSQSPARQQLSALRLDIERRFSIEVLMLYSCPSINLWSNHDFEHFWTVPVSVRWVDRPVTRQVVGKHVEYM